MHPVRCRSEKPTLLASNNFAQETEPVQRRSTRIKNNKSLQSTANTSVKRKLLVINETVTPSTTTDYSPDVVKKLRLLDEVNTSTDYYVQQDGAIQLECDIIESETINFNSEPLDVPEIPDLAVTLQTDTNSAAIPRNGLSRQDENEREVSKLFPVLRNRCLKIPERGG